MFDHDCSDTPMGYFRFMKAIIKCDANLGGFCASILSHEGYHKMIVETILNKPDLYNEMCSLINAMDAGIKEIRLDPNGPLISVREQGYAVVAELRKSYSCEIGFVPEGYDASPSFSTVYVHMNIKKPVWGLPQELMTVCDRLAWDVGSVRKWTFGFDNRIMLLDMPNDALEYLLRQDVVKDVVFPSTSRILSAEVPKYNPDIPMEDWGITRINPRFAWARNNYGQGIKLCVIDTGIRADLPAFWKDGKTNFKGGRNFIGNTDNPADDHDHGTYCCSIAAAQHNGLPGHYHGVAPGADLYACKVLDAKGSGSNGNIAAAVDWCRTNKMDILSMSLGGPSNDATLQAACDNAWYAGLVVVCAAGNSGPAEDTVGYPGALASTIAVAASDPNDNIADFSSRGPQVEITAPGHHIVGAWAGFTFKTYTVDGSNKQYICASGTSAACPHAAGAATLMKAWYPLATNVQIRQWLRDYAIDI